MSATGDAEHHRFAYHTIAARPAPHPGPTKEAPGPMIVGVHGSDASRAAVSWTAAVAAERGTEVVVVHALPFLTELLNDIPPTGLMPWRRRLRTQLLDHWCAPLLEHGVGHRVVLVERPVVAALVGVAEREHATRIVIGLSHRGRSRWGHGSLAHHLLDRAPCPVITIPPAGTVSGEATELLTPDATSQPIA